MFSVIIPTYNRSGILKKCLEALNAQTLPKEMFEVIVIDDGSTDNTEKIIENAGRDLKIAIEYHRQKNKGQGTARNFGLKKARGDIVVFIGDDILVREDFLEEHRQAHIEHPEENAAVLGYVTWDTKLEITPFMHFLEHGGHQFAYDDLKEKKQADYNYFYTANISLKKNILGENPFDPDFKKYGWEDIELGYRLTKGKNLKIYYNPKAVGYHHHAVNEDSFRNRMRAIGQSAHIFHQKHPELQKVPQFWKYCILKMAASRPAAASAKILSKNLYYKILTKKYFLEGLDKK